MALYHKATITPSKLEVIQAWLPSQSWSPPDSGSAEAIGAFRFDDPEGAVGMEVHLVRVGDMVVHVPLTYRAEPMDVATARQVGTMEHSALGTRWVYDGLSDPRFVVMLAGAALTGQGEALGMVVYDGEWTIAPTNIRIRGGGWGLERVSVDGFVADDLDLATVTLTSPRFAMRVDRLPQPGTQPSMGLTASGDGLDGSIVLATIDRS